MALGVYTNDQQFIAQGLSACIINGVLCKGVFLAHAACACRRASFGFVAMCLEQGHSSAQHD